MRSYKLRGFLPLMVFTTTLFILSVSIARAQGTIDWGRDTVSKTEVMDARNAYTSTVKRAGLKGTQKVSMPVDKLKTVIDALSARGITDIDILITTIRPQDIPRYRHSHNTTATDEQLKWSQILVLRIPRAAFPGYKGAGIKMSNNATLISLLSMGLVLIDQIGGLPSTDDDLYLDLGTICPPPTVCD